MSNQPRAIAGKLPPHDLPRERGVLGACMLHGPTLERVSGVLEPEDFFAEQHQLIFAAMLAVVADGGAVDVISVRSKLDEHGQTNRIGGASYLAELINDPTTMHTIEHHAAVIAEHAVNRAFARAMQEAEAEIYCSPASASKAWRDQQVSRFARIVQGRGAAGTVSMRDASAKMAAEIMALEEGKLMGLTTGLEDLDRATGGLLPPQVYLVGGATGGGKSAFAHCLAMRIAELPHARHGIALFSLEMRAKEVSARCACAKARVDWKRIASGEADRQELQRYFGALQNVGDLAIEVDEDSNLTPMRLRGKLRAMEASFAEAGRKLSLAIVDYVQLMAPDGDSKADNREKELSEIGKSIKYTAELFNVPMLVLTQLTAEGKPRDCKALEYHAPNFWIVEHFKRKKPPVPGIGEYPNDARIEIAKGRFVGDGSAAAYFHKRYTLFTDEAV